MSLQLLNDEARTSCCHIKGQMVCCWCAGDNCEQVLYQIEIWFKMLECCEELSLVQQKES